MIRPFILAFALIVAVAPARGDAPLSHSGYDCPQCLPMEFDRLAALLGDDVLRDMVCRLSSARFTPGRLSSALGIPEGQVLRRLNTLRGWGLVRLVRYDSATTIVEPLPGSGAETLGRWASRYCSQGDACGRPTVNPDAREAKPASLARGVGVGGYASQNAVGTGLQDKLVTVFGGSGFIGRELLKRLSEAGARVRLVVRDPDRAKFVRSLGGAERVSVMTIDIRDPADIETAINGAHSVVNLIGILSESVGQSFVDLHEHASRRIAEAGKAERLVQFSTVSANPKAESVYSRTKAAGEAAAIEKFPNVTVVRPSLVFDPEGGFVKSVAEVSRFTPVIPLIGEGKTLFQPVYVGDVSMAIVRILEDPGTMGRTYELGGPRTMTLRELATLVQNEAALPPPKAALPSWLADVQLAMYKWLPKPPGARHDPALLREDSVVHADALGLIDLGISPTRLEDVVAANRGRSTSGQFQTSY